VIINHPLPNEVTTTPFGMIASPCVTSPPKGDGAHCDIPRTGNTALS
jgi:hypothetical protein